MQKELNNFERNQVWNLVERPNTNVIGTKWVFHNKQDDNGVVLGTNTRVPKEEELMTINIDSSE